MSFYPSSEYIARWHPDAILGFVSRYSYIVIPQEDPFTIFMYEPPAFSWQAYFELMAKCRRDIEEVFGAHPRQ